MILEERLYTHKPVLLHETIDRLMTDPQGLYLDATLGLGGHSEAILQRLTAQGRLLAIDTDPEAIDHAQTRLEHHSERFHAVQSNFRSLQSVLESNNFFPLTGALFDLGVSSLQLDKPSRGFSFLREGPLDMRLGPQTVLTAETIVNRWPAEQIAMILEEFGEELDAEKIARAIVKRRSTHPIKTTTELAACIESVIPRTGHHPATRTFQALRIAVNQELESLTHGLESVMPYLKRGGRICVITFHSLEDRIVKNIFSSFVAQDYCTYLIDGDAKSPVSPSKEEVSLNPRCRSAKLRVIQKKS